jgi:hypothetical protein
MTIATENPTLDRLIEKYNGARGEFNRSGVAVLANKEYYKDPDGAIRWVSSDNVVPADILEMAVVDGTVTMQDLLISKEIDSIEGQIIIERYFKMREKHGYSDEERFEMRAAFGDEPVVDVFTGKQVTF